MDVIYEFKVIAREVTICEWLSPRREWPPFIDVML